MDVKLDSPCPYCQSELIIREMGEVVTLNCSLCQIVAVLGDDRFITTRDMASDELERHLRKRAERVAEWAKEAKDRYTEVKR